MLTASKLWIESFRAQMLQKLEDFNRKHVPDVVAKLKKELVRCA